jgi:hypothetical protein
MVQVFVFKGNLNLIKKRLSGLRIYGFEFIIGGLDLWFWGVRGFEYRIQGLG